MYDICFLWILSFFETILTFIYFLKIIQVFKFINIEIYKNSIYIFGISHMYGFPPSFYILNYNIDLSIKFILKASSGALVCLPYIFSIFNSTISLLHLLMNLIYFFEFSYYLLLFKIIFYMFSIWKTWKFTTIYSNELNIHVYLT